MKYSDGDFAMRVHHLMWGGSAFTHSVVVIIMESIGRGVQGLLTCQISARILHHFADEQLSFPVYTYTFFFPVMSCLCAV
jgi:hypothetical protein